MKAAIKVSGLDSFPMGFDVTVLSQRPVQGASHFQDIKIKICKDLLYLLSNTLELEQMSEMKRM